MLQIGQYNIEVYQEKNYQNNIGYHLVDISKWKNDTTIIKQNFVYLHENSRSLLSDILSEKFEAKEVLEKLLNAKKNSVVELTNEIKVIIK